MLNDGLGDVSDDAENGQLMSFVDVDCWVTQRGSGKVGSLLFDGDGGLFATPENDLFSFVCDRRQTVRRGESLLQLGLCGPLSRIERVYGSG